MGLGDIYQARRRPQQPKVAKAPKLIPPAIRAQRPSPRPRPAPAAPAQARPSAYADYWARRRAEDEARGQAIMQAIAEAPSQAQAKRTEQPNPDPFARAAREVVETFAGMARGGQR